MHRHCSQKSASSAAIPAQPRAKWAMLGVLALIVGVTAIPAYATKTDSGHRAPSPAASSSNPSAAPAPVISPAGGVYTTSQTVTISDTVAGATIYYTTDGSYPTTNSTVYTGPITVSSSETIAAYATANGYGASNTASAAYWIQSAQSRLIYTVAGNFSVGYAGDGGPATQASLNSPWGSVIDSAGNLYIADSGNNLVRKVAASTGIITNVAGTGVAGYSGDNGPANSAQLSSPTSLALDATGNLYIADFGNNLVRKVAVGTGVITTYAGSSSASSVGDNGPATSAKLDDVYGMAIDPAGYLYITELCSVRRVNASTGIITTVVGSGYSSCGYSGDGGKATDAYLFNPEGLAVDSSGDLYIADTSNDVIRKVNASTGIITTVAGNHSFYTSGFGDGGPATNATLGNPRGVAVDTSGNLYIDDTFNALIWEVTAGDGIIHRLAGHFESCDSLSGDGEPAADSFVCFSSGISLDKTGNLYFSEAQARIRKITPPTAVPANAAAAPVFAVSAGTYSNPQTVRLNDVTPGAVIYLTINGAAPTTADAGYYGPIQVTGSATLQAIAVAPGYLPSTAVTAAYTITTPPTATISTEAGSGISGASGAGGPATQAQLGFPEGLALDSGGNLYIADYDDSVIWKVAADTGNITVVAGTLGTPGNTGNGGPATSATLQYPTFVAVDSADNLYIADSGNNQVRKVSAQTGIISLFAGGGKYDLGDGGPATSANLVPVGMAFDVGGNLYIADVANQRVRVVSAITGIITTAAGGATDGLLGDGGLATAATLSYPYDVKVDSQGNLYIADEGDARVRMVTASTGIISTIAGNGNAGASGDGGPATAAEVYPESIALDSVGNLYIANPPYAIRMVSATDGTITTVAGNGFTGSGGDGGSATMAGLCDPDGVAIDKAGNLHIAESCNYRIRKVTFPPPTAQPTFSPAAGSYIGAQTVTLADSQSGATIYYTTDGSTPTTGSNAYSAPIVVSSSETVKAIGVVSGYGLSSVASAAYVINKATPDISGVSSSANPSLASNSITFTATLTSSISGIGAPTGSIAFLDGTTQLGSGTLSSGTASYTASSLAAGSHAITAVYSGDGNFASVTSAALTQIVESFSIGVASTGSASSTLSPGGQANYTLVATAPSVGAPLTFSVTGLPTGATATFSPATVAVGSGSTNVTFTVSVPATTAAAQPAQTPWKSGATTMLVGLMLLPFTGRFRKLAKQRLWLAIIVLCGLAVAAGMSGCSGGGSSTSPTSQTYQLEVVATSGSLTQSTALTLTVQ